jgi:hypothetical protein
VKDKIVKVPGVVGWGTLTADERKKQASRMGKVGGKVGGPQKSRGDRIFYQAISRLGRVTKERNKRLRELGLDPKAIAQGSDDPPGF